MSIILLTKNGETYLQILLDGLYRQENIACAEVIVIDSGSTDRTLQIIAKFPNIKLTKIPSHEFGHGRTRNLGARLALGKYLVFLPQDATPVGTNWLTELLTPFSEPAVSGVFAQQIPREEASPMESFFLSHTYHNQPLNKTLNSGDAPSLASCFFSTVSGAIRASAWASQPFREEVIMSEDQAWARDIMLAGQTIIYQPKAKVLHSHQYTIGGIFKRNFDSGYSVQQIFSGKTGINICASLLYLANEGGYVFTKLGIVGLPHFLIYEMARHSGFLLGLHAEYLPLSVCKVFGNLDYFWKEREMHQGTPR